METIPWTFHPGIIAAFVANTLWYWMKYINKSKGFNAKLFTHSGDFKNFKEVIRNESSIELKRKYQNILKGLYLCILITFISFACTVALVISQSK